MNAASGFYLVRHLTGDDEFAATGDWYLYRAKTDVPDAAQHELEQHGAKVELQPLGRTLRPGGLLNLPLMAEGKAWYWPNGAEPIPSKLAPLAAGLAQRHVLQFLKLDRDRTLYLHIVGVNSPGSQPRPLPDDAGLRRSPR
ncbi:MAG: hypothetical protein HYY25_01130 [Candidatus Wallbacteria bacterium]|nr:hypothetical protein [Candidatus Wallbacteria bacterium]